MPRERIYGEDVPFTDDSSVRTLIDLSWSRDAGHVQLGTIAVDASTGDSLNIVERFGSISVPAEEHECPSISGGLYLQLNREAINRLIRQLRRARDQAFGRDE